MTQRQKRLYRMIQSYFSFPVCRYLAATPWTADFLSLIFNPHTFSMSSALIQG
ncbi:MAG: hypothetical protein AB7D92_03610 [Sphaerochaeta sp.]